MVPMTTTPAATGNPHFQFAESALGAAQNDNRNAAKAGIAQARATLALAHEQRTASLIAARDALFVGLHPGEGLNGSDYAKYEALTKMIDVRLGVDVPAGLDRPGEF